MSAVVMSYQELLAIVQEELCECLGVDADETVPTARFFDDLGGESIDVLDLTFRCERRLGVQVRLRDIATADPSYLDEHGRLTPKGVLAIKQRCPWLDENRITGETPRSLFTVEFITRVVEHSLLNASSVNGAAT